MDLDVDRLIKERIRIARQLQFPITTRDYLNKIAFKKEMNSREVQNLKNEAIKLLEENNFYDAIEKITRAIEVIENDKKELVMFEKGENRAEIKIA